MIFTVWPPCAPRSLAPRQTRTEGSTRLGPAASTSVDGELPAHIRTCTHCFPTRVGGTSPGGFGTRAGKRGKGKPLESQRGLCHESSWMGMQSGNYKGAYRKIKEKVVRSCISQWTVQYGLHSPLQIHLHHPQ